MATDRHRTAAAAATASAWRDAAALIDPMSVSVPVVVSPFHPPNQRNQQNQRKRSANKPKKTNTTNTKTALRLTNKQRIDSKLLNLTLDVHALQEELRSLEFYRNILRARVLQKAQAADGSFVRRAQQYFSVFQRGYRVLEAESQIEYLQAAMDDSCITKRCPWAARLDGQGPTAVGRAEPLEQWQTYTSYFALRYLPAPTVTVVTTDADKTCIVRCETSLHASFTWQALHLMFPAAKSDPLLMEKLLGREMITPICFYLHFDGQGRIVRIDFAPDFFAALLHVLDDPVQASMLLEADETADEGDVRQTDEDLQPRAVGQVEQQNMHLPEETDARFSVLYLLS